MKTTVMDYIEQVLACKSCLKCVVMSEGCSNLDKFVQKHYDAMSSEDILKFIMVVTTQAVEQEDITKIVLVTKTLLEAIPVSGLNPGEAVLVLYSAAVSLSTELMKQFEQRETAECKMRAG